MPMILVIDYDDGSSEALEASLESSVVSVGQRWIPGILVQNPANCYFQSDFFECAISEGGERSGIVTPEEGIDDFTGFRWRLVGSEAGECRKKMMVWIRLLGDKFDPDAAGGDYLHEGLLRLLSDDEVTKYDGDRDCWLTYLEEPDVEALILKDLIDEQSAGLRSPKP